MENVSIKEYLQWYNEPSQREILDAHLASMQSILINTNSKKKVKPKDLMILVTEQDKKEDLSKQLKAEFAKFGSKIKITERG